jgi:hypothetical protein
MRLSLMILLLLSGCSFLDGGSSTNSSGGQNQYGFGVPTLELTINGVHFGPAAPDTVSTLEITETRDALTGRVDSASFHLHASSAKTGARCDFDLQKFGDGTAPITTGTLQLVVANGPNTADGSISPAGAPSVTVPQGSWSCGSCTGAIFALSALDSQHAEGYLSGSFDSTAGAGSASVVCSFYLPIHSGTP